jgi:hypothetical protein
MSKITVGLREFFLHTLLLKGFSHKAIGQELPVFLLGRHMLGDTNCQGQISDWFTEMGISRGTVSWCTWVISKKSSVQSCWNSSIL